MKAHKITVRELQTARPKLLPYAQLLKVMGGIRIDESSEIILEAKRAELAAQFFGPHAVVAALDFDPTPNDPARLKSIWMVVCTAQPTMIAAEHNAYPQGRWTGGAL